MVHRTRINPYGNPSLLAQKLRRLRVYLKMSRVTFAEEVLQMPPTSLKNWELGYRDEIPARVLCALYAHPDTQRYIPYLVDNNVQLTRLTLNKEVGRNIR